MATIKTETEESRAILEQWLKDGARTLTSSCSNANLDMLEGVARNIIACLKSGGKVLLCGNGGSAAQAQHIAAELVGRFKRERQGLAAMALTTDTSILTAVGNDYGYESIFARQVESLGRPGDILIALSTSGNSPNILKAVEAARSKQLTVVGFTGQKGGKLAAQVSLTFRAASDDTSHAQEAHITALHALCDVVEASFSS